MKAHVLRGSKQEIADGITRMTGEVREAIVFVDDPSAPQAPPDSPTGDGVEDIFAEMEPYMVKADGADDSRESIYSRLEGE